MADIFETKKCFFMGDVGVGQKGGKEWQKIKIKIYNKAKKGGGVLRLLGA